MGNEKQFENRIKKFLKEQGAWFVKYWSGGSVNQGKKFTKDGVPDILVCLDGRFLGIEVKAENGKPSALQIHNLKQIDKSHGFAILLYPENFELFKNLVLCIKDGDVENTIVNYGLLRKRWLAYEEWNN